MDKKSIILFICDGMGDLPHPELGGKTPLQVAIIPNMDEIATRGQIGIMDVIAPGVTPGSDTAHLSLLGYDTQKLYTGRGPFEAAGAGIEIREGDVAFRCNFSTVDGNGIITDRRAGRIRDGTVELAGALDGLRIEDVQIIFKAGVEHRGALVFRGEGLSPDITDVDPHETGQKIWISKPTSPRGEKTARVLNAFVQKSIEILSQNPVNQDRLSRGEPPANVILPRGGGVVPRIPHISQTTGMRVAGVAGVTLVKGVCKAAGLENVEAPGATGGRDTNMMAKAQAAIRSLEGYDMVVVNIKAPDLAGHDNQPKDKMEIIERIDKALGHVLDNMPEKTVLALTADHSTPCIVGDHTGDPVPLAIYSPGNRSDLSRAFDEISCLHGGLGRLRGNDLLPVLSNMAGRAKKYGA